VTGVAFNKVGETEEITYTTAKDDTRSIPVANYFYKVALKVSTNAAGTITSASTIGFWFEHREYVDDSYTNYAVSVDDIEAWTGFDFFVNLPDNLERVAEANKNWSLFQ
jgi:endonuclease G